MIHNGFVHASWMAAIIIFLLVLVDFRRLRDVLLTMFPLCTAIALSLGILGAIGIDLNMANQLFLPILMGIGIDYGIFMTHRWREPDGSDLTRLIATMGNALWLAAATAITGFGSLSARASSRHDLIRRYPGGRYLYHDDRRHLRDSRFDQGAAARPASLRTTKVDPRPASE